jgi:hypothetical protein
MTRPERNRGFARRAVLGHAGVVRGDHVHVVRSPSVQKTLVLRGPLRHEVVRRSRM